MFRINYLPWYLFLLGTFILFNIDSLWSLSVDIAHHYALAYRISEQWWLTAIFDPTLGEMNIYPRGGHIIAAIVGAFFNSTFIGLQLTTLASVAIIWISILAILNGMPQRIANASLLSFFLFFLINTFILRFGLHGHEVVSNYFFSQLVAQAFLYLSLIFSMRIEKKIGELWAAFALLFIMSFVATIHLLPAIQILGLIGGITAIKIFGIYMNSEDYSKTQIAIAVIIPVVSIIVLVFHPSFSAMLSIGANNGALKLHNIPYPLGIIALSILVLLTSFILFMQWARHNTNVIEAKYFSILGASTAALCLIQYTLNFYDIGSDYAVKKYGFSLLTISLIQLSIIFSLIAVRSSHTKIASSILTNDIARKIILTALGLFVLLSVVPNKKTIDASKIVEMEKRISILAYSEIPQAPDGKSNVVIGLSDFSNTINYLFSIAFAKTQRDFAISDVLIAGKLSDFDKYYKVISSSGNANYGSSSICASSVSGDISIIDSLCLEHQITTKNKLCENSFNFSTASIPLSLLQGFSVREDHGRWTNGKTAQFMCLAGDNRYNSIKLELTPFIYGSLKSQRLEISVNGIHVYQNVISTSRDSRNPVNIDLTNIPVADEYVLEFNMPDAISPKEVGLNDDGRMIAFSIYRIAFH